MEHISQMLSSLSFPPRLLPLPQTLYRQPQSLKRHVYSKPALSRTQIICFSLPSSDNSEEEARWLREEQRWLREEQRWLREESRWNAERLALLQEISSLKHRIQELERIGPASASDTVGNIAKLLQVLKESDLDKHVNIIADSGTSTVPLILEAATKEEEEIVVKEVISIPERKETVISRTTLRMGSEGDDVRAMQEALQKLGYYSGEEDIEYSSFSSGTERAVKTWQSSIKAPEDGIMTSELLDLLFGTSGSATTKQERPKATDPNKKTETDIKGSSQVQKKTVVTEEEQSTAREVSVSENRVYLLGENRWEEPSRLSRNGNKPITKKASGIVIKCLTCRGEGRVLCMECDGTGEPNIEPQFLEWVDEGTKCPYCEGLGHTTCDACGGKTTVDAS